MMQFMKNEFKMPQPKEKKKIDIIVTKYEIKVEYKDGVKIERRVPTKVNLTKKMNETKKILKAQTAEEKIKELEKIFSK